MPPTTTTKAPLTTTRNEIIDFKDVLKNTAVKKSPVKAQSNIKKPPVKTQSNVKKPILPVKSKVPKVTRGRSKLVSNSVSKVPSFSTILSEVQQKDRPEIDPAKLAPNFSDVYRYSVNKNNQISGKIFEKVGFSCNMKIMGPGRKYHIAYI